MLQRQHDLEESRHSGRRLEMADVGLDRADQQRPSGRVPRQNTARAQPHFDRVAERGAGSVRLDIVDGDPSRPAAASASRITASWAGPFGTVRPLLWPS